ncbi:hypothetical protein AAFF_G00354740 [Aldrovandia affinis]|uniref:Endonuclease/exonuclease/phosphatase domain-containing protein n=1 Tax=Aldrovandia affinis TaxID=143900 RepID=A0AAD7WNB5_9TELE|nr:hypothetical protein AAFF_G00354740 [Aldrovandia affinis]
MSTVTLVAVYIPPEADKKEALSQLHSIVSEQQAAHPDGFLLVGGDFNHANLKSVAPRFYQHVGFATRNDSKLDLVYSNIRGAYRAYCRPPIGTSDHKTVMMLPVYRPRLVRSKPATKTIRTWPEGATSALQDCLETTDWNMFREAATQDQHTCVEEYSASVTGYIEKIIEDVTVEKTIATHANQKPWMTAEPCAMG